MKKPFLTLLGVMCAFVGAFAQSGTLKTSLLDEKNTALSFANVLLYKGSDSSLVKATVSDANGKAAFEDLPYTQYFLTATMVGYEKHTSAKVTLSAENANVELPQISMKVLSGNLAEVTVAAKKPLLEQQADKLVMNVENSIVSAGSTALEVLRRAPGVMVDQNDNISLKGKQGVMIYMDGKPTYMSQEQLTNMLKNMNADQIEKIELITNPSARYDAAGNSGIINIVVKRNKNFGTNGSVSLGGGVSFPPEMGYGIDAGNAPKVNGNLNLNNRQGKINTFGNVSSNYRQGFNTNVISRNLGGRFIEQVAWNPRQSNNTSVRAGLDYFASKTSTLGFLVNASIGSFSNRGFGENKSIIKNGEVIESNPQTTTRPWENWRNITFNTNFKKVLNAKGRELTADADYSIYTSYGKERGMVTTFLNGNNEQVGEKQTVTSDIPKGYNIAAFKVDFTNPLPKNAKLELGAKASFVDSDNDIKFYNNGAVDIGRTNHFLYTEQVQAGYINYSKKINEKANLQAGLRAENTYSNGESLTLNENRERNYLNFFPSLYLTRTLNKANQLNLNFSRRIDRPDYQSLNPFIFFLDPYTYELGNQFLKPQFTQSFELSHTFKSAFVTTLGYSNTQDFFTQVVKNASNDPEMLARLIKYNNNPLIDPSKISFAIQENLGTRENYNLSTSMPIPIKKWWNANVNLTGFYNHYKGEVSGEMLDIGNVAYNFYINNTFKMPKNWSAEASMWYNSKSIDGMFERNAMYAINGGISKSMLKKKGTLRLTVNDIFATAKFVGKSTLKTVDINIQSRWDSRQVRGTFTYRFGNQNVKASRNRQTASSAEQNRAGTNNN